MLSVIFRFNKKPGYKKLIKVGFQNLKNFCYSTLTAWDALVFIVCNNLRISFARQKAFGFFVLSILLKNFQKNFISGSLMCFQIDIVLVSEVKRISQKLIHPSYFPSFRGSSSESFLYKRCFLNFLEIHRKTIVVKSLFHKVAGLPLENLVKKRLQYSCFPGNFMNYLIMLFLHKFARWLPLLFDKLI